MLRIFTNSVWIPEGMYKWLPFWCLFWASMVWVIPTVWYGVISAVVLYVYGGWLIYVRYIE